MPDVDLAARRLASQHLLGTRLTSPAEVVRSLGAVQAQDYAGAKWALGMRTAGATDAAVERAFAEGAFLRTHVLRPTWHFVPPEDLRWMLALTASRIKTVMGRNGVRLGLTDEVYRRSNAAIERALRGGKQLTRAELAAALKRARIDATGTERLTRLVMWAELDAVICSGARRGKQFTYALLEERVPPAKPFTRDEALHELTRRYFATRGPATAQDFAWWSGLTVADATRGIQMAGDELQHELVDGRAHWSGTPAPAARVRRRGSPVAHLLPNYDEYFIGFKDRSAIARRLKSLDLVTGGNALIAHVVTIDGQLVGGWRRLVEKKTTVVQLTLLDRLTTIEERAVATAASSLEVFLGAPVELRW